MISRRDFLKGISAALAAAVLPEGTQIEPEAPKAVEGHNGLITTRDGEQWWLDDDTPGWAISPVQWTLTETEDLVPVPRSLWEPPPEYQAYMQVGPAQWSAELVLDFDLELGKEYPIEFLLAGQWWRGNAIVIEKRDWYEGSKIYALTGSGTLETGNNPMSDNVSCRT